MSPCEGRGAYAFQVEHLQTLLAVYAMMCNLVCHLCLMRLNAQIELIVAVGCRALEYVDIAAQTEPASVFNSFLRLKIYLLRQDSKAAGDQIKAMLSCEDFSHEILRVSMGFWLCKTSMHGS